MGNLLIGGEGHNISGTISSRLFESVGLGVKVLSPIQGCERPQPPFVPSLPIQNIIPSVIIQVMTNIFFTRSQNFRGTLLRINTISHRVPSPHFSKLRQRVYPLVLRLLIGTINSILSGTSEHEVSFAGSFDFPLH